MQVYHDFFLVPGSRSTFLDTDPDPGQWYGSDRIRIRNTDFKASLVGLWKTLCMLSSLIFTKPLLQTLQKCENSFKCLFMCVSSWDWDPKCLLHSSHAHLKRSLCSDLMWWAKLVCRGKVASHFRQEFVLVFSSRLTDFWVSDSLTESFLKDVDIEKHK